MLKGRVTLESALTQDLCVNRRGEILYVRNWLIPELWGELMNDGIKTLQTLERTAKNRICSLYTRGGPGSGKTYLLAQKVGVEPKEVLGIDNFRGFVSRKTGFHNAAVHGVLRRFFPHMLKTAVEKKKLPVVVDLCIQTFQKFQRTVLAPQRPYELHDVDTSLAISVVRVLSRKTDGNHPQTPFDYVVNSFKEIRSHRKRIMEHCRTDPLCWSYTLFHNGEMIALKVGHHIWKLDQSLYRVATSPDTQAEVEETLQQKITPEFLEPMVANHLIRQEDMERLLQRGFNKTIEQFAKEQKSIS